MTTLEFLQLTFNLDLTSPSPIEIPNIGRDQLAEIFYQLHFKTGAEIGTERGLYAEILCQANPQLQLLCIDPWATYPNYRTYISQASIDDYYAQAQARLKPYNCHLIKDFSEHASHSIADQSLDFVYIDGNHSLASVLEDITVWEPKVRPGGIVAGHDYIRRPEPTTHHVIEAVNQYVQSHTIQPWFILGRKFAPPPEMRDKNRSWMWVKA